MFTICDCFKIKYH